MVQSKSVSELSQISGLSDLPIPTKVENFLTAARRKSQERKKSSKIEEVKDQTKPADYYQFSPMAIHDNIYQTLPKSMKIEVMVKSKVQLLSEITQTRKECVSSKSVGELAQINSLADLPIPTPIQKLWETTGKRKRGEHTYENGEDCIEAQYTTDGNTFLALKPRFRNYNSNKI